MSDPIQPFDDRIPLYQPTVHLVLRVIHGFLLLLVLVGLIGLAFQFPTHLEWHDLVFPFFCAAWIRMVTLVFHTKRVYGSTRGLEYNVRKTWVTVPWSLLDAPEFAWWSYKPILGDSRVATLRVPDRERPIYFFASDRIFNEMQRLRDQGILAERTAR